MTSLMIGSKLTCVIFIMLLFFYLQGLRIMFLTLLWQETLHAGGW